MKNQTKRKPAPAKFSLLQQLCNLIPNHLVPRLAREHTVEEKCRTFLPWTHVISLFYAQLTYTLELNEACDALRLHSSPLSATRLQHGRYGHIQRDDLMPLTGVAGKAYPVWRHRVVALVEVDGLLREMVFPHQQPDLEHPDHYWPLSMPVEHQIVLQGTQADPPTG
jgi:hypothetical protein